MLDRSALTKHSSLLRKLLHLSSLACKHCNVLDSFALTKHSSLLRVFVNDSRIFIALGLGHVRVLHSGRAHLVILDFADITCIE